MPVVLAKWIRFELRMSAIHVLLLEASKLPKLTLFVPVDLPAGVPDKEPLLVHVPFHHSVCVVNQTKPADSTEFDDNISNIFTCNGQWTFTCEVIENCSELCFVIQRWLNEKLGTIGDLGVA